MKNKKIIFFSNFLTPYQKDFLSEVSILSSVSAVFSEKKIINLPWKISKHKNFYNISNLSEKKKELFYQKLFKNFQPNVILIGGYKIKDLLKIIKFFFKKKIKIYFFLEKPKNNFFFGLILKKFYLFIFFKFFKINGIFAVGKSAENYYKKICNNVFNLPYSINGDDYKKIKFSKYPKKIKFIFIGQLIDRKNINLLLKSFEILNNTIYGGRIYLTIVGDGPARNKIKQLSKIHTNLKYQGFVSQNQLKKIIYQHHILILPSKKEGWGVVVNQAMASGLCLIISKKIEIYKDFFKENINGVSINNSVESLCEKMIYLIKNTNKVEIMGKNNYQYFFKSKLNVKNSVKYFLSKI